MLLALEWFARRPLARGAIPGRIEYVPPAPPAPEGTPPFPRPNAPAPVPVQITWAGGSRLISLRGVGASPSAPLPRAWGFLISLLGVFAVLSAIQLLFFDQIYLPYD